MVNSKNFQEQAITPSREFRTFSTNSKLEISLQSTVKITTEQEKMFYSVTNFFVSDFKRFSSLHSTKNGIVITSSTLHSPSTHQKKTFSLFLTSFHLLQDLLTLACK